MTISNQEDLESSFLEVSPLPGRYTNMNKANQSLQCPELGTACLPGEAFHGENL